MSITKHIMLWFGLILILLSATIITQAQKSKKTSTVKKSTATSQKGTLSIEAGLVYKNGDVKPVARVEFYLLDTDLKTILSEAKITPREGLDSITTFALALSYPNLHQDTIDQALVSIKSHTVSSITTDFQGKANIPSVKVGTYYLYGFTKAGNSKVLWNLSVSIKSGQNLV